jgi:hypothetical protein
MIGPHGPEPVLRWALDAWAAAFYNCPWGLTACTVCPQKDRAAASALLALQNGSVCILLLVRSLETRFRRESDSRYQNAVRPESNKLAADSPCPWTQSKCRSNLPRYGTRTMHPSFARGRGCGRRGGPPMDVCVCVCVCVCLCVCV